MPGGSRRHRMAHRRIAQQQIYMLRQCTIRLGQQASLSVYHILWVVQVHGNRRQAASSRLAEHLRMTLDDTGKKKNMRSAHFFPKSRWRKMPEERDVAAPVLLAQPAAICFVFTAARQAKLHIRPEGGLLDDQFDSLPRTEGASVK